MAGLIGLALTSCSEDNSLGTMQKNEAPVVVAADGVALQSLYATTGNSINLQAYQETFNIPLVAIEVATSFPEGSTVTGEVEVADNIDFKNAATIALTSVEAAGTNEAAARAAGGETYSYTGIVNASAWNEAFVSFYGLNPSPNVNYLRYKLWLNNGKQNVILYNNDGNEWFDTMEFTVTPFDAQLDVAAAYTLFYSVGGETSSVDMYHNPDKHVYDDPTFNAYVDVPESGQLTWWVAPADMTDKTYGVLGDDTEAAEGELGLISEGAQKGSITTAGTYKIDVNMLDLTFEVKIAPPSLYVMSYSGITFAQAAQLGTNDNVTYSGMAGLLQKWGLAGQAAYKPTLYVNDANVDRTESNGTYTGGIMVETSGAPLNADSGIPYPGSSAGLYYITANLQNMTYTGYQCKTLGCVGSPNGWGDDFASLKGSRTTFYMEWTGEITVSEGDEWKIRANSDWAVNFGGADGGNYTTDGTPFNLSMDGANLVAPAAGTYIVTVYLRRALDENGNLSPYYMTVTPKE